MILKRRLLRLYLWHLRNSKPNWYTTRHLVRGMPAWIRMRAKEGRRCR